MALASVAAQSRRARSSNAGANDSNFALTTPVSTHLISDESSESFSYCLTLPYLLYSSE